VHQTDQWLNGNLQNATQISGKNMALKTGALQALRSAALSGRAPRLFLIPSGCEMENCQSNTRHG
jgi:hypothetical protein